MTPYRSIVTDGAETTNLRNPNGAVFSPSPRVWQPSRAARPGTPPSRAGDPGPRTHVPLAKRVRSGVGWNASSSLMGQVIGFVRSIVIARLLVPDDFGLFSMALTIVL